MFVAGDRIEARAQPVEEQILRAQIGGPADAVRDGLGAAPVSAERRRERIVDADDRNAVVRQLFEERVERANERGQFVVAIEMIVFDIGDDRHRRREQREGSVRLVGFGHEPRRGAVVRVRFQQAVDPAQHQARVDPAQTQRRVRHRGRRGLSVRAAHRNAPPPVHDAREHLAAMQNRRAGTLRGDVFGIAPIDRRTDDDGVRARDVARIVTDGDARAFGLQLLDERRALHVGTGHGLAASDQNSRDCAHADAADPDEVIRTLLHAAYSPFRAASAAIRARMVAMGSMVLSRCAAARSASRRCGTTVSARRRRSRPASSSRSATTTAAPAAANFFGVGRLVVLRGERIRDQNRRHADRREFAERRRARARQHQIRGGEGVRKIVQVRPDRTFGLSDRRTNAVVFLFTGDVDQLPPCRQPVALHQRRERVVDRSRALTAAHREQRAARGIQSQSLDRRFARRQRAQRGANRNSGERVFAVKARVGVRKRAPDFVDEWREKPVGQAGTRVGLEQRDRAAVRAEEPQHARCEDGGEADVSAGRDHDVRAKLAKEADALQRSAEICEKRANEFEGNAARQRAARHDVQAIAGVRNDRRFETIRGTDEVDRRRIAERAGDRDRRVEVAARTSARENHLHALAHAIACA